jgi:predicted unusual protein kinase regulating ubiquinone biosynthesis (AarF/ABC1/UbiB family)
MFFGSSIRRLAHLVNVIVRHVLAHALTFAVNRWPRLERYLAVTKLSGPERLRTMVEDMGGTFIKFGQMLALQPDILPVEYCNALFNLLDRVAPFSFAHVEQTFVTEFGKSPREIFDDIEVEPVATASIGQVHVARLNGRKVAVKVQRPNVDADFNGDIRLMTLFIRLIQRLHLRMFYWLVEPTSEFVTWTSEELDYRREARYMEQQRRIARGNPHERVPEVFADYVSRRTLVVEFIDGLNLLDYLRALKTGDEFTIRRLEAKGFDPDQFVYHILENFLSDAYRFGMFHADLQPANLMILPDSVVGYVDFGITGMLSRYSRQNIVSLTMALGGGDLEAMCAAFFKISTVNEESDVEGFRHGMRQLNKEWYETVGNSRRLKKNATLVMLDMLMLSRETGIYPERDVVKYIRSAIAIDGLITRVAPEFDLGRHLELICNRHLKWHARSAVFSYSTMAAWASSSSSLMTDGAIRAWQAISNLASGQMRAYTDIPSVTSEDKHRELPLRITSLLLVGLTLLTIGSDTAKSNTGWFTPEFILIAIVAAMLVSQFAGSRLHKTD